MQATGRPLDVALQGKAWLAVQALDGTEAYTRAGALQVNAEGQLVTPGGPAGAGRRRADHAAGQCRGGGGVATARITTKVGNERPQLAGRLKLVDARGAADARRGRPVPRRRRATWRPSPTARLQSGALEGSNVSPVETMVAMIAAARQFEQQMKVLQGAEQREQAASRLLAPQ